MHSITFQHQDGDMTFRVAKATFAISAENRLTLSIVCESNRSYTWMADPSFCLVEYPLEAPLGTGTVIRFAGNAEESDFWSHGPRAHAYVGVHETPRHVKIHFMRVSGDECDVAFSWSQSDVNYYDGRAEPNRVIGSCTIRRGPIEEMWIPS